MASPFDALLFQRLTPFLIVFFVSQFNFVEGFAVLWLTPFLGLKPVSGFMFNVQRFDDLII